MKNTTDLSKHFRKRFNVLCFGDSLTELGDDPLLNGWVSQFRFAYKRRCDVYNRGLSGYNTSWALKYMKNTDLLSTSSKGNVFFLKVYSFYNKII